METNLPDDGRYIEDVTKGEIMANFLQDNRGNNSSMRLGFILWVVGVLVSWVSVVVATGKLPAIPESVVGVLALFLTGKVAQTHVEENKMK